MITENSDYSIVRNYVSQELEKRASEFEARAKKSADFARELGVLKSQIKENPVAASKTLIKLVLMP